MADKSIKKADELNPFVLGGIADAVRKAMKATPVTLHSGVEAGATHQCYMIDGEVWSEEAAMEHILGEYSWWKE